MPNRAVECFWGSFRKWFSEVESQRATSSDKSSISTNIRRIVREGDSEQDVAEKLLKHVHELIDSANRGQTTRVEHIAIEIIHGGLDYIDSWGGHTPVTAAERDAIDNSLIGRSSTHRLKELVEEKGEDYESEEIPYLSYCILGHWSILHEIHKKAHRLVSVTKEDEPNFETAEDNAFDLCNYSLFLLAYLDLPSDIERSWVIHWNNEEG